MGASETSGLAFHLDFFCFFFGGGLGGGEKYRAETGMMGHLIRMKTLPFRTDKCQNMYLRLYLSYS